MKFLLLIVNSPEDWQRLSADAQQKQIDRMNGFDAELKAAGKAVTCGGLAPPSEARTVTLERAPPSGARTVIVQDAKRDVRSGTSVPVANTRDCVTGYFVIDAASVDEAVEWAKRMPILFGSVEVRAVAME